MSCRRLCRMLLPLLFAGLLSACGVSGVSGPGAVTPGQTATYTATYGGPGTGTNVTVYGYADVPLGWTFAQGSYSGTVNGAPASGPITLAAVDPGACVLGAPAAGYQRIIVQAGPFPTVVTGDGATVSASFVVGGATGSYTLQFWAGATTTSGPGACQGAPPDQPGAPATFGVTVTQPQQVPALGSTALALLLLALAGGALLALRVSRA